VRIIVEKLAKRMHNGHGWLVTLKCIVTVHRLLRDTELAFVEELIRCGDETGLRVLSLSNYKDMASPEAWDFSSWIRVYTDYLDESVEIYRSRKFDIMAEKSVLARRMQDLKPQQLLEMLERLQMLERRLVSCIPEGKASYSNVVKSGLVLVVKESFRLYHVISEGIVCMVDQFFDMDRVQAQKAMEVYRAGIDGTESMSDYYRQIKHLGIGETVSFPELIPPPSDFLGQMESYINSAPVDSTNADAVGPHGSSQRPGRKGIVASPALHHARSTSSKAPAQTPAAAMAASQAAVSEAEDLLRDLDIGNQAQPPPPNADPFGVSGAADPFGSQPFGAGFDSPTAASVSTASAFDTPTSGFAAEPPTYSAASSGVKAGAGDLFSPQPAGSSNPFGAPFGGDDPFAPPPDVWAPSAGAAPFGPPLAGGPQVPADPFAGAAGAPPLGPPAMMQGQPALAAAPNPFAAPHAAATPALGSSISAPATGNPFAVSGLQHNMMTTQSRKSVHDPFSELTSLTGMKSAKDSGIAASAPMRAQAAKPSWSNPSTSAASVTAPAQDPFGSLL